MTHDATRPGPAPGPLSPIRHQLPAQARDGRVQP